MKNRFFITLLGFRPFWDYKQTNANHAASPGVYASDKILNFCTIKNSFKDQWYRWKHSIWF